MTRVLVNRGGSWVETLRYQTAVAGTVVEQGRSRKIADESVRGLICSNDDASRPDRGPAELKRRPTRESA